MKKYFLILFLFVMASSINANNIKVEDVKYDKSSKKVSFKISWENAWRQTSDFHDAAWVFCKYKTVNAGRWLHTDIKANSTSTSGALETKETNDKLGFFVRFKTDSIGHIKPTEVSFEAENIIGLFPDFKVFAIEMVYVPEGEFYAGTSLDDSSQFKSHSPFYMTNKLNNVKKIMEISSEDELKSSSFTYNNINGTISSNFPKGYAAFYCMKHEISNGQFIEFLKHIDNSWINSLGINSTNKYIQQGSSHQVPIHRNSIAIEYVAGQYEFYLDRNGNGIKNEPTDGQYLAAKLVPVWHFNYTYWAGLTPMTEFQFEKACRGPLMPIRSEGVSGVSGYEYASVLYDMKDTNTEYEKLKINVPNPVANGYVLRCGYAADSSTNRITSNATFYGILNMGDNVSEYCIYVDSSNNNFNANAIKTEAYIFGDFDYINRGGAFAISYAVRLATRDKHDKFKVNISTVPTYNWQEGGRGVRKPD